MKQQKPLFCHDDLCLQICSHLCGDATADAGVRGGACRVLGNMDEASHAVGQRGHPDTCSKIMPHVWVMPPSAPCCTKSRKHPKNPRADQTQWLPQTWGHMSATAGAPKPPSPSQPGPPAKQLARCLRSGVCPTAPLTLQKESPVNATASTEFFFLVHSCFVRIFLVYFFARYSCSISYAPELSV